MRQWVDFSSRGIEALAVVIIVGSIIFGSSRFLLHLSTRVMDPYREYKELLGRSLLLALEFLVAADVIHTVLLDLTPKGVGILGALVVIRTFLSWSVVVEIEGHWPWQLVAVAAHSERVGR
jgi:uncharacterized membrane protein